MNPWGSNPGAPGEPMGSKRTRACPGKGPCLGKPGKDPKPGWLGPTSVLPLLSPAMP